jgi:hypothetical protein
MTVSRRSFLRSGAATVLLTGLALEAVPLAFAQQSHKSDPKQDFKVSFEAKQEPTFQFQRETFEPYLNGIFKLSAGARSVEATLVKVRDCKQNPAKSKVTPKSRPTECFLLVFQANGKLTDLTTVYDVEHGALGKFALFLTQREGPGDTYYYEAVFNRAL